MKDSSDIIGPLILIVIFISIGMMIGAAIAIHTTSTWWITQAEHTSCDCAVPAVHDWEKGFALFGIEDPAEAIREAREMLERCYQVHNAITIYTPQSHQDKEANREHCDNIKAVLAKLQPKQES